MKLTKRIKMHNWPRHGVRFVRSMPIGYYKRRPWLLRTYEIGRYEAFRFMTDNVTLGVIPLTKVDV